MALTKSSTIRNYCTSLEVIQSDLLATESDLVGIEPEKFNFDEGLSLKSVSLHLPNENMKILANVSFTIKKDASCNNWEKWKWENKLTTSFDWAVQTDSGRFFFCGVDLTEAPH